MVPCAFFPACKPPPTKQAEVSYIVPEGWEDLPASGIRKANLKVSDENGTAELTVLVFPGDVGGRLANINRWRGQVGLDDAPSEDLPKFTESYTISQHPASMCASKEVRKASSAAYSLSTAALGFLSSSVAAAPCWAMKPK
jgi:hypothetical protein